jgi:tetratricopeptide (TPR) repeat protein
MKSLLRDVHVSAMIIALAAAVPAITLPNAPARAGFDEDQQLCNTGGTDPASRTAACTRQIESGRWQGLNLAVSYSNRGIAYFNQGEFDRAIADYNQALTLNPKSAAAYNNRGNAYNTKHDYDRAIADYSEAIILDPKYAAPHNGRGNVYNDQHEFDRAIADYNDAITLDPKNALAFNGRGLAYAHKGELDPAIADYNQALTLEPKYLQAVYNRALAYKGKAIADFREIIAREPNNAGVKAELKALGVQ